jgi:hypothetical protein
VSQQSLQGGQVGAGLEQVGGVTVTQGVHAGLLGDASGQHGQTAEALHLPDADGAAGLDAGKQAVVGAVLAPVVAQTLEQQTGQRHEAVLVALAATDVQGHARRVDVAQTQVADFGDAQAAAVGGLQEHGEAVIDIEGSGDDAGHLVLAEDSRQRFGLLAEGNHLDHARAGEGDAIEQAQGADGLVEAAPGRALGDKVELIEADVLGVEVCRGATEVAGEGGDG